MDRAIEGPPAQTGGIHDLISERVGLTMRVRARDIERRILSGDNRIVIDDEFAGRVIGRTVYEVPSWRREPVKRAKVAWARFLCRRKMARQT